MWRLLLIVIGGISSVSALAAESPGKEATERDVAAVLSVLAERSALSPTELNNLLADCNASQQSMYFCAWRNQLAAERLLEKRHVDAVQRAPECKRGLDATLAAWQRRRDQVCNASAKKQWGEGSLRATAVLTCIAAETSRMADKFSHLHGCNLP